MHLKFTASLSLFTWPVLTRPNAANVIAIAIAAFLLSLRMCIKYAFKCGSQSATLQTAAKIMILDSTDGNNNLVTKPPIAVAEALPDGAQTPCQLQQCTDNNNHGSLRAGKGKIAVKQDSIPIQEVPMQDSGDVCELCVLLPKSLLSEVFHSCQNTLCS